MTAEPGNVVPANFGGPHLPESFWSRRPLFQMIRQHADATLTSPDAVLGVCLVRLGILVPPTTVLPPIVGSFGSLDLIAAPVGGPSAGKSAAGAAARDLIPFPDWIRTRPLGSGEGIPNQYLGAFDKDLGRRPIKHPRVLFTLDEGGTLTKMMRRQGSTHAETIRSAWSGEALGQANADQDKDRDLPPRSYRFGLVVNFQPSSAVEILAESGLGTPQRFLWIPANRAAPVPDTIPDRPNPIDFAQPDTGTIDRPRVIELHRDLRQEIEDTRRDDSTRDFLEESDEGHDILLTLKVAGILAATTNGHRIDIDEYRDAMDIVAMSHRTRRLLKLNADRIRNRTKQERRDEVVRTAVATDEAVSRNRLALVDRVAHTIGRKVWRSDTRDDTFPPSELWKAVDSTDRGRLLEHFKDEARTAVLDRAVDLGVIEEAGDDHYRRGRTRPAEPGAAPS